MGDIHLYDRAAQDVPDNREASNLDLGHGASPWLLAYLRQPGMGYLLRLGGGGSLGLGLHLLPGDGLGEAEADAGRVAEAVVAGIEKGGNRDFRDVHQRHLDPGLAGIELSGLHGRAGQLAQPAARALLHVDVYVFLHRFSSLRVVGSRGIADIAYILVALGRPSLAGSNRKSMASFSARRMCSLITRSHRSGSFSRRASRIFRWPSTVRLPP